MTDYRPIGPTPREFVKTITLIHLALLSGQVIFAIVAYIQHAQPKFDINTTGGSFVYVAPILALTGFTLGNVIFKQLAAKAAQMDTLAEKLMAYQTACIVRFALLEAPSLFGIVAYLISGNLFFMAISGLIILYFLYLRPTKEKIADDLSLSYEDKMELDGSGEIR